MVTMIEKETGVVAVNVYSALVSFNSALMPRMGGGCPKYNRGGEHKQLQRHERRGIISFHAVHRIIVRHFPPPIAHPIASRLSSLRPRAPVAALATDSNGAL